VKEIFSCTQCNASGCFTGGGTLPPGCITNKAVDSGLLEKSLDLYRNDPLVKKLAITAAQVEGQYYCKATRVEEIIYFAQKSGAKKVGIATCVGLIREASAFARLLKLNDLEPYGIACKAGSIDKTELGIPDEGKVCPGGFEPICNPVLQALLLNQEGTELNVICGLCVGHDSLFIKYSEAPVTTLIAKDRVLIHNPAAALYSLDFYSKRLKKKLE